MLCANLLLMGTGMLDDEGVRDLQERVNVVMVGYGIITSTGSVHTSLVIIGVSLECSRKAEVGNRVSDKM